MNPSTIPDWAILLYSLLGLLGLIFLFLPYLLLDWIRQHAKRAADAAEASARRLEVVEQHLAAERQLLARLLVKPESGEQARREREDPLGAMAGAVTKTAPDERLAALDRLFPPGRRR